VVNAVVGIGDVPAGDVAPEADVAIVVRAVSAIQQALHAARPHPAGLSSRVKSIGVVVMYLVAPQQEFSPLACTPCRGRSRYLALSRSPAASQAHHGPV
jgi:hypothetical protein